MKKSLLVLCMLLPFSTGTAFAESVWAPGVSLESGWFDTNKAYNTPLFFDAKSWNWDYESIKKYFPNTDYNLCWAATASNILEYINYRAGKDPVYSSTYIAAEKIENPVVKNLVQSSGQYASYEKFTTHFKDKGFYTDRGIEWYTTGGGISPFSDSKNPWDSGGGYHSNIVQDFGKDVLNTSGAYFGTRPSVSVQQESFKKAFEVGPVALSIYKVEGTSITAGHAITSWGYETDEEGDIIGLYITDSDDGPGEERLRLVELKMNETENLMTLGGDLDPETKRDAEDTYYPLYSEDGIYSARTSYENYSAETMSILAFSSYNNFIPMVALIPEPSAFGLLAGLGALACVASRRKNTRKR